MFYRITAIGEAADEVASEAADVLRARGFTVQVVQYDLDTQIVPLLTMPGDEAPAYVVHSVQEHGIRTLRDLANMTFEHFWTRGLQGTTILLELMRDCGVRFVDADPAKLLKDDIDDMGLGVRAYNRLASEGIRSSAMMAALSDDFLLDIRNLGQKCLDEVRQKTRPASQDD